MDMKNGHERTTGQFERREWVTPRVTRMAAGDAELASNPIVPDGQIGNGS